MNKKNGILIVLIICFALMSLTGCEEEAAQDNKKVIRPIKVMTIGKNADQSTAKYPGKIEAGRKVDFSFRVPGPLVKLPIRPGLIVKQGEMLAQIDPRDYEFALNNARAAYNDAMKNFERYRKLMAKGAVSKSAYDSSQSAYLRTKAALDQANAALKDTKIYAPFDGVIAKTYVENHQDVQAKQPIASLQSMTNLEVVVQIPEQDVLLSGAREEYETKVRLEALPGEEFPARVKEFTTEADPTTQTFKATFILEHHENFNILPGMTAEVILRRKLSDSPKDSILIIPVESVLVDENNNQYIWKLKKENNTVHRVSVKVQTLTGDCIVVTKGLAVGDTIAVAGVHYLHEGMEVSIFKTEQGRCGQ